ncbi:MAG: phosphatase PAP2 family protein [Planctomycetota bacterium]
MNAESETTTGSTAAGAMRPWPIDWVHGGAHLATIVLLLVYASDAPGAGWWLLWDLVVLALIAGLVALSPRRGLRRAARDRMLLTIVAIPVFFTQLGILVDRVNPNRFESRLAGFDRAVFFGRDPLELLEHVAHPLLTEYLQWVYDFYYFIPVILGAAVLKSGDVRALARMTQAFAVCIYLSYVGYYLVPATGPNMDVFGLYDFRGPLEGVFLAGELRETLFAIEKIKLNCFPSGHTAVSLLSLLLARRATPRTVPILTVLVVSLIFSTLYLRYHYFADVLAGILLAVASLAVARISHRSFERRHWGGYGNEG